MNWLRRPTDTETAHAVAVEEARREQLLLLADPQLPPPVFGPLPTADDMLRTVYACGPHAITRTGASLIHRNTCTAPDPARVPGCDCTPEPPASEPVDAPTWRAPLPDHWTTGT